ncbi:unnamed protein product [Meganyctiphanes norvegica]|uniref:Protein O-mannosyl-transferase 2 n=1 Tax=Meganyctiphanes norvegica TaxID=48144 RepID=A0AAV2QY32_MEGNR
MSDSDESSVSEANSDNKGPLQLPFRRKLIKVMDDFRDGSSRIWWSVFWCFVALALGTRLHYITMPSKVVWDEAHFGKMLSWYINRTYFFDVHPPGGKLLLTLFGYLAGYNGTHDFKQPGVSYEGYEEIFYIRIGCAILGAGMVPLAFHTVWSLTRSLPAAAFAGSLVTFEIGTITLSKFILLDPLLFFFMMASFHSCCVFHTFQNREFSTGWWLSLAYSGAMLGCVMSVKFVGLFIVLVVGLYTATDLWNKLGEMQRTLRNVLYHLIARILGLIILPAVLYISVYAIHEQILDSVTPNSNAGETAQYSSGFQMRLKNTDLHNLTQPGEVAYGNVVSLRTDVLGGVYLHSHNTTYPKHMVKGHMQQVIGYRAKDINNVFRILFPEEDPDQPDGFYGGQPEYVTHGDWVRLFHINTNATLSCHRNKSFVSRKQNLVYTKLYNLTDWETVRDRNAELEGFPDDEIPPNPNITPWELWAVHIIGGSPGEKVRPFDSRLKLICVPLTCGLTWTDQRLPLKWGFLQPEISCGANLMDPKTEWIVEANLNPYMKNRTFEHVRIGFWQRFIESHQMMSFINARLKPAGDDLQNSHRPWMWPIMRMSQVWYDVEFRIVLLGNPIIFWVNLIFLMMAPSMLIYHKFRDTRGYKDKPEQNARKDNLAFACKWLLIAYLMHYVPFWAMDRILYYHHYFPALQFSSMLTAVVLGYLLESLSDILPRRRANHAFHWGTGIFLIFVMWSFHLYKDIGYGYPTVGGFNSTNSTYRHLRFFEEWYI